MNRLLKNEMVASSTVAGAYCRMSSSTGRWVEIETPRSPLKIPRRKIQYCSHNGRSSPHRARYRATMFGSEAARSPSCASTGSPGTWLAIRKTTSVASRAMTAMPATRITR